MYTYRPLHYGVHPDDDDVCVGCYRTLEEIGGWGDADAEERLAILDRADDRYRNTRLEPPRN